MGLSFISSGVITNEAPHFDVELEFFSYQIKHSGNLVSTSVSGDLPQNLSVSPTGLISGTLREMDEYIPEFAPPEVIDVVRTGEQYATWGSAQAYTRNFTFTVSGVDDEGETDSTTLTIVKVNNYSSDRDFFIHQMEEAFGILDFDGIKKYFKIDGVFVTADEFISYQKSQGLYPNRGG